MVELHVSHELENDEMFFLPMEIKARVLVEFRRAGIPYKSYTWRDYDAREYAEDLESARLRFREASWEGDVNRMGAIESKVPFEDLFALCLMLFGDTMDGDERRAREQMEREMWESYLRDYQDLDGVIQIHSGQ